VGNQSIISLTINGLKQRLDKDNSLVIQKTKGFVIKVKCLFNDPASTEDITSFDNETRWKIPGDLYNFLLIHNGGLIFESEYDGGLHQYSLDEMKSNYLPHMPEFCYPIGYYEGEYLFVDSRKCLNNELEYLFWDDSASPVDKWVNLESNFELWFDRFIVSQGSHFWEWRGYHNKKYYNL
jgi:hypothetical protein